MLMEGFEGSLDDVCAVLEFQSIYESLVLNRAVISDGRWRIMRMLSNALESEFKCWKFHTIHH